MNKNTILKFLGFIFKLFAIVNFILVFGDLRLGEYEWAIVSGACSAICHFMGKLIDSTEIK